MPINYLSAAIAQLLIIAGYQPGEKPACDQVKVSQAVVDSDGFQLHNIQSPYQGGATTLRVLLPSPTQDAAPGGVLPVVYMLPVEAGRYQFFGDGLLEAKKHDLHNKHRVIFAAPSFSALPWYADHPDNAARRQESYFLKVILPAVEKHYPAMQSPQGRLLLGYSKSGWGAWTLLLRNPELFSRAVAWDTPLMMQDRTKFGAGYYFASQPHFEEYQISRLLAAAGDAFRAEPRLISVASKMFLQHHQQAASLLQQQRLSFIHRNGPHLRHHWHSGWVAPALELLLQDKPAA